MIQFLAKLASVMCRSCLQRCNCDGWTWNCLLSAL